MNRISLNSASPLVTSPSLDPDKLALQSGFELALVNYREAEIEQNLAVVRRSLEARMDNAPYERHIPCALVFSLGGIICQAEKVPDQCKPITFYDRLKRLHDDDYNLGMVDLSVGIKNGESTNISWSHLKDFANIVCFAYSRLRADIQENLIAIVLALGKDRLAQVANAFAQMLNPKHFELVLVAADENLASGSGEGVENMTLGLTYASHKFKRNRTLPEPEYSVAAIVKRRVLPAAQLLHGREDAGDSLGSTGSVLVSCTVPDLVNPKTSNVSLRQSENGRSVEPQDTPLTFSKGSAGQYLSTIDPGTLVHIVHDTEMFQPDIDLEIGVMLGRQKKILIFEISNHTFQLSDAVFEKLKRHSRKPDRGNPKEKDKDWILVVLTTSKPSLDLSGQEEQLKSYARLGFLVAHQTTATVAFKLAIATSFYGDNINNPDIRDKVSNYVRNFLIDPYEVSEKVRLRILTENRTRARQTASQTPENNQHRNFFRSGRDQLVRIEEELRSMPPGPKGQLLGHGVARMPMTQAVTHFIEHHDANALVLRALAFRDTQIPALAIIDFINSHISSELPYLIIDHSPVSKDASQRDKMVAEQLGLITSKFSENTTVQMLRTVTKVVPLHNKQAMGCALISTVGASRAEEYVDQIVERLVQKWGQEELDQEDAIQSISKSLVHNTQDPKSNTDRGLVNLGEMVSGGNFRQSPGVIGPIQSLEVLEQFARGGSAEKRIAWVVIDSEAPETLVHLALAPDATLILRWGDLLRYLRTLPGLDIQEVKQLKIDLSQVKIAARIPIIPTAGY